MTPKERNEIMYEWAEVLNFDEDLTSAKYNVRIMKKGIIWFEYTTPKEQLFYNKLSDIEKISIDISCDPLNVLMQLIKREGKDD